MAKLKIIAINKQNFTLQNIKTLETYNFNIKFFGLEQNPEVGHYLSLNDELLNPTYSEYSTSYQFGPLNEDYGRKVTSAKDIDCITVFTSKKTFLKRFFG